MLNQQEEPFIWEKIFSDNCLGAAQNKCKSDQFQCKTGVSKAKGFPGPCIPKNWENDGNEDCMDGSDENSEILMLHHFRGF